ncbi:hypothetical protein [Clostridium cellulovorans]|uniref:hypothetical protein n=1 Tax=Clostridium cellulovorans TaxID=1493 RepID=UPI0001A97893|nr:hypothetical protein [Clostridium cellulovorans]
MRLKGRRKNIIIVTIVIFIGLFAFLKWQNNSIIINEIIFKNNKIPEVFNGYRILHISDLHNKEFGNEQSDILRKV